MLIVELNKPSLLTFKGAKRKPSNKRGQLVLSPGDNEVSEEDFLGAWKSDPTIKGYFASETFSVYTEDGAHYEPPDAPQLLRRSRRQIADSKPVYRGAQIAPKVDDRPPGSVPSVDVKPPSEAPAAPEPDAKVDVAPTMMGGGVPGADVAAAKAAAAAETDPDTLRGWLQHETREGVLKIVRKTLDKVEAES